MLTHTPKDCQDSDTGQDPEDSRLDLSRLGMTAFRIGALGRGREERTQKRDRPKGPTPDGWNRGFRVPIDPIDDELQTRCNHINIKQVRGVRILTISRSAGMATSTGTRSVIAALPGCAMNADPAR